MSPKEIAAAISGNYETVRSAVVNLKLKGVLVQPVWGSYELAESSTGDRRTYDEAAWAKGIDPDPDVPDGTIGPTALLIEIRSGDRVSRHELRWHHGPMLRVDIDAKESS